MCVYCAGVGHKMSLFYIQNGHHVLWFLECLCSYCADLGYQISLCIDVVRSDVWNTVQIWDAKYLSILVSFEHCNDVCFVVFRVCCVLVLTCEMLCRYGIPNISLY